MQITTLHMAVMGIWVCDILLGRRSLCGRCGLAIRPWSVKSTGKRSSVEVFLVLQCAPLVFQRSLYLLQVCSKAVLASPSLGCTPGRSFFAIEEGGDRNRLIWWIYPCHSLRADSLRVQRLGLRKTCDLFYLAWHMARYGKVIPAKGMVRKIPGPGDPAWYPPR